MCARRAPEQPHAWLWELLRPTLLLHHPVPGAAAADAPLPHSARSAALLSIILVGAFEDRDAGLWRSDTSRSAPQTRTPDRGGDASLTPGRVTSERRRELPLVRYGQVSATAHALRAARNSPRTLDVCKKARNPFPPRRPGLASPAKIEADLFSQSVAAVASRNSTGMRDVLPRSVANAAVHRVPRGCAPGPPGLCKEHLWDLGDEGQASLAGVVRLRTGEEAVRLVSPLADQALARADILPCASRGGVDVDGVPWLRAIGMFEVLR